MGSLLGSIRAKTAPQSAPSQDSGKNGEIFRFFGFFREKFGLVLKSGIVRPIYERKRGHYVFKF